MIELTQSQFDKRMKLVTEGVANDLRNELLNSVPVDTGALKISIKVKPKGKDYIISMLDYGLHVEFGTYKQRANPFIRNTIHLKFKQILSDNIRRQFT